MTLDDPLKPPPPTVVISTTLSRVDVGLAVAAVARSVWSDVEARAGLNIALDAWGPVVGDDTMLERLLRAIVLDVLAAIPAGAPEQHVIGLTAQAAPGELLVIEVRHQRRGAASKAARERNPEVAAWDRLAGQFAARVEEIEDRRTERCYRITLRMVN